MAAIITTWDPTSPAGSDNIKDGDDSIRTFKVGLTERLRNGGHQWQTAGATTDSTDGRHCAGESNAAGSSELVGEFVIYAADTTTAIATFRDSTAATPSEWFAGANKIRTTGNITAVTGTFSGAVTTGALTVSGAITPTTDNTLDLGDASHRFNDAWFGGTVTFSGSVVHSAAETFAAGATVQLGFTIDGIEKATYAVVTATSYTVATTDIVILGKTTGTSTYVLPLISSSDKRILYITIATGSFGIIVNRHASNGSGTVITLQPATPGAPRGCMLICDTTDWFIINTYHIG